MAELIYKGVLKNCYAGDFRMDGKTPCTATYASIRKMIDIQPTTTESEIRAKAIDEFAEKLKWEFKNSLGISKRVADFTTAVINMVAEQLKERE